MASNGKRSGGHWVYITDGASEALGSVSDTPWDGLDPNATEIAILKAIYDAINNAPAPPITIPNYDSGNLLLTASFTQPELNDVDVFTIFFTNITGVLHKVSLTDGDDVNYLVSTPVKPNEPLVLTFSGLTFSNGFKWKADANDSIRAQLKGNQ